MAAGVYCAECKIESEPGALFCATCGRPLRRFAGPRGVERGPGEVATTRRRRSPWIVGGICASVFVLLIVAAVAVGLAVRDAKRTTIRPVGATVDAGKWRLVVRSIDNPSRGVADSAFPSLQHRPASGNHFIAANVTLANISGSVNTNPVGAFFELRDKVGHRYFPSYYGGSFRIGGTLPLGGLDNRATLSGPVVFEVPDTARNLTLYFSPNWPLTTHRVGFVVPQ